MKQIILILNLLVSFAAIAKIESTAVQGKVISFDAKTVTIEIAGKNHTFDREKLGKSFSALKKGEIVEIDTPKDAATIKK